MSDGKFEIYKITYVFNDLGYSSTQYCMIFPTKYSCRELSPCVDIV